MAPQERNTDFLRLRRWVAHLALRHHNTYAERQVIQDAIERSIRLEAADELKNTFLAAVSHEMRTPLTSILGFAVTLHDRPEIAEAQRLEILRTIVKEAEHLEEILINLLDLDRLTRGRETIHAEPADASQIVSRQIEIVRQRSGRTISLRTSNIPTLLLDVSKLQRIVDNLVGNAVKYTPSNTDIDVAVNYEAHGIVLRVDDQGSGIAEDLRQQVFEPFRRGDQLDVPGTGLGLSLVDRFSRMHGGRAWVESNPSGGARFQVFLRDLATEQ